MTYRSAMFVSSSGQRRDVTVTSLCLALAMTSLLLSGDVTAAVRWFGVVILFRRWSFSELFRPVRTATLNDGAL